MREGGRAGEPEDLLHRGLGFGIWSGSECDPNINRRPLSASVWIDYHNLVLNKRIAFQGEPGAYSEEAILLFDPDAVSQPCREFRDVAATVLERRVDLGLLPIENSLVGSIATNFDLIAESELAIVGEVVSAVHHCLLGVRGARPEALRRVLSHPVALAQCERFLRGLAGVEAVAFYDTAGAAAEVAARNDAAVGAVAGALAARRYGLEILAERIEDEPHNQTRFFVVAREPAPAAPGVAAKTTLRLKLPHRPGSLARALAPFADAGLNLTKLESRPDRTAPWNYLFYLDVEARAAEPAMQGALAAVQAQGGEVRVLGEYPRFTASV